jgi:hypothetical protein
MTWPRSGCSISVEKPPSSADCKELLDSGLRLLGVLCLLLLRIGRYEGDESGVYFSQCLYSRRCSTDKRYLAFKLRKSQNPEKTPEQNRIHSREGRLTLRSSGDSLGFSFLALKPPKMKGMASRGSRRIATAAIMRMPLQISMSPALRAAAITPCRLSLLPEAYLENSTIPPRH